MIVTLINAGEAAEVTLGTPGRPIVMATQVTPIEEPVAGGSVGVSDAGVCVRIAAGATVHLRIEH